MILFSHYNHFISCTQSQLQTKIVSAINTFSSQTLNTFNSILSFSDLILAIQQSDPSIIANEVNVKLQKKFNPTLNKSQSYKLYYGTSIQKGVFLSGISSSPSLQFLDLVNGTSVVKGVYIQELPTDVGGVNSISLLNPGFGYQYTPTVTIVGDGSGATAEAKINASGAITSINVLTAGTNYTTATVVITPTPNDTTGQSGSAIANLTGSIGTLQSYYYNENNVKTIFNPNIGTVDYNNGVVTLSAFDPIQVDNIFGQLTITANPQTSIISSSYNRIITIDPYDPSAITVNVTVQ